MVGLGEEIERPHPSDIRRKPIPVPRGPLLELEGVETLLETTKGRE
jgi:hypothetical protein